MLATVDNNTGKLIEFQSHGDRDTMLQNAINIGVNPDSVMFVDAEGWKDGMEWDGTAWVPGADMLAEKDKEKQRKKDEQDLKTDKDTTQAGILRRLERLERLHE